MKIYEPKIWDLTMAGEKKKKGSLTRLPVFIGDAFVLSWLNMHKQTIRKEMMAIIRMPAPIPRISIKFGCLPLFEVLGEVEAGEWWGGALTGAVATRGAV